MKVIMKGGCAEVPQASHCPPRSVVAAPNEQAVAPPRPPKRCGGFTLTELAVLVAVGAVLTGLLFADLNQTRTEFLQQACAANLKKWGMAIYQYTQDNSGTYYYALLPSQWDDSNSPYYRYLGGSDTVATMRGTTMRRMRLCPAVQARMTPKEIDYGGIHTYSMPVAMRNVGGAYQDTSPQPNGFWGFNLKTVPHPSQYLLMIDSKGYTLKCGGLVKAVTTVNTTFSGDSIPAIDRHGGGVNCLFGDFHVEWVSSQTLSNQDKVSCITGNPWFMMN